MLGNFTATEFLYVNSRGILHSCRKAPTASLSVPDFLITETSSFV